jgi:HK97 family phage major capsid protein
MYLGSSIKALDDETGKIGGYLVYYGSPEMRDLDGEYFTRDTNYELDWYEKRPILFHHGGDGTIKSVRIGVIKSIVDDGVGLWAEGIIEMREKYNRAVYDLVKRGILDWSSGTLPDLVEIDDDGFIKNWPIVEGSTTPTPAMPMFKTRVHSLKGLVEASKGVALELPEDDRLELIDASRNDVNNTTKGKQAMNPEEIRAIMAELLPSMVQELLTSMQAEKGDVMGDELEVAKQAMEDEAENVAAAVMEDEDIKAEDMDEEEVKKSVREAVFRKAADIAFAGMQAIAEHKETHQQSMQEAIKKASDRMNEGVHYGRAKSNVGGGSMDSREGVPALIGKARKPGLADFVKCAANHDFTKYGKAQNPYIGDHGGYLLGQELRDEILPPLREKVVAFDAGVRQTNVAQGVGTITLPKMTTAPGAYRPGINTAVSDSDASFDTVTAFLRPIAAMSIIPFQLLEQSPLAVEDRIREEMIRSIALQVDIEILTGTGTVEGSNTGAAIRGIKNVLEADATLSSSNITTLATNGRKPTFADASAAETQIAVGNVPDTMAKSWIMHARSRGRYRDLVDTTGQPLFRENFGNEAFARLLGYPVHVGNQISVTDTTGTSSDTSEIYYGAWEYIEYVMQNTVEIIVDRVTLANQLQARIIAYTYSDILIHYPEAFYIMKGVR